MSFAETLNDHELIFVVENLPACFVCDEKGIKEGRTSGKVRKGREGGKKGVKKIDVV